MADEILKNEILTDEQLEQVAGGSDQENKADHRLLEALNFIGCSLNPNAEGFDEMKRMWAKFGITVNYNTGDTPNEYFDQDGNKINRWYAVNKVMDRTNGVLQASYAAFF